MVFPGKKTTYLGDGIWVQYDSGAIVITDEQRENAIEDHPNTIHLEPEVARALIAFILEVLNPNPKVPHE